MGSSHRPSSIALFRSVFSIVVCTPYARVSRSGMWGFSQLGSFNCACSIGPVKGLSVGFFQLDMRMVL